MRRVQKLKATRKFTSYLRKQEVLIEIIFLDVRTISDNISKVNKITKKFTKCSFFPKFRLKMLAEQSVKRIA